FIIKQTAIYSLSFVFQKTVLLEYELVALTTRVGYIMTGTDNDTYLSITFHLHRLYGYHITNSFFPTLLMTIISYSTYFFQVDDFTNRIMISLTAQLVLASLFTSTTASSVKTPYLKLIDVWYAAIITFCFLIVMTQVYINTLLNSSRQHWIVWRLLNMGSDLNEEYIDEKGSFNGPLAAKKMNKISCIALALIVVTFIIVYSFLASNRI
ncbi:UNVERIFIED_CONTAM: hypothetical protein GTU68_026971, partial [Idotea baltica]|nr:hypothetical protein [Idotea baltica]